MRDSDSMLGWMQRLIRRRREVPEFGSGTWRIVDVGAPEVLGVRCDRSERSILALHNFSNSSVEVDFTPELGERKAVGIWSDTDDDGVGDGGCTMLGYVYRWIRLRHPDDGLFL